MKSVVGSPGYFSTGSELGTSRDGPLLLLEFAKMLDLLILFCRLLWKLTLGVIWHLLCNCPSGDRDHVESAALPAQPISGNCIKKGPDARGRESGRRWGLSSKWPIARWPVNCKILDRRLEGHALDPSPCCSLENCHQATWGRCANAASPTFLQ